MGRQIVTKKMAQLPSIQATPKEDPWVNKVLKLIPADVVAVYLGVYNLIKTQNAEQGESSLVQWIVFGIIAIITPLYLKKVGGINDIKQIVLCEVSFFIWVLSIGGPLDGVSWGSFTPQFIGAIILPIYTLVIPIVYKD